MNKKSIFLTMVILVMGLVAVTSVMAQNFDEATAREMEQLANDLQTGKITLPEFQRRMVEIQSRVQGQNPGAMEQARQAQQNQPQLLEQQQQAMQQAQRDQQQQQQVQQNPGETRGWPSAAIFSQCNLPNLRQPTGTTVSYTYRSEDRRLQLYIVGGTQNIVTELSRAIEADGKATYKDVANGYFVLPAPSGLRLGSNANYQVTIVFENGRVELFARSVTG